MGSNHFDPLLGIGLVRGYLGGDLELETATETGEWTAHETGQTKTVTADVVGTIRIQTMLAANG